MSSPSEPHRINWTKRAREALGLDTSVPVDASAFDHFEGRRALEVEAARWAPLLAAAYAEGYGAGKANR